MTIVTIDSSFVFSFLYKSLFFSFPSSYRPFNTHTGICIYIKMYIHVYIYINDGYALGFKWLISIAWLCCFVSKFSVP